MAKQIQFTGINRAVSDYSDTGACEELINLRPTNTGLVPVKDFTIQMNDTSYCKVYEHNIGTQVNYIGVSYNYSYVSIDQIQRDGTKISALLDEIEIGAGFSIDSLHVATTGRILTISISDKVTGTYANYAFRWKNNGYSALEASIPPITASLAIGEPVLSTYDGESMSDDSNITAKAAQVLSVNYNAIQTNNPSLCFGPCIVAIAFKTTDGDTFWTGQWFCVNPMPTINSTTFSGWTYHFASGSTTASHYPNTIAVNGSAYCSSVIGTNLTRTYLAGAGITMTIDQLASGTWNKDTSVLKAVEIYASRPVIHQDYSLSKVQPETYGTTLALPELPAKEMNLGGQLLYLQKSISLEELAADEQEFDLHFGGNIQITDKTLEVDPGMIVRTGSMLAYNARYHFYNANKRVFLGKPYFGADLAVNKATCDVFVTYESDNIKKQVYVGQAKVPTNGSTGSSFDWVWDVVTAPTLNITKVTVMHAAPSSNYYVADYTLSPSTAYNYSIDDSGDFSRAKTTISASSDEYMALKALIDAGETAYIDESETDAINVSEQYNPFVFRVNHSYLAPATVLDLQPQLMAVADISIGNAPLDVFTSQGVYALLQGDGTVLYGAFRALSNLISESNSASTDAGTFFIASGNLWRIAGLHSELVSDALSLGPHKEIRSCSSYQSLSNNSTNTYDIQPYESDPIFEDYSKGATLVYNRFRDELIVSNPSYGYSYVLSLKYRQWFKITRVLRQEVVGSDIAISDYATIASPGSKAKVILILRELGEGALIQITIFADSRQTVVIAYYEHSITSEERQAILQNNYNAVRDNIIAEWNASQDEMISKYEMSAEPDPDPNPAPSSYRYISLTVRPGGTLPGIDEMSVLIESEDNPDTNGSFVLPYDIMNFSDEIESETTHIIPANVSQEIKINTYPGEGDGFQFILTFNGTTTNILHITTAEEDTDPTGKLIPHFVAEINANATVQALGLSVEALNTPDIIDLLVSTTRALDDITGNGMLLKTLFDDWGEEQTIASTALNIPVSITAHLQSRPISFGYQYAHIHRVVDMVRSTLRSANNLTVALYGSDDLHTWTLLSYANREGSAAGLSVSQLRTPSTARAWRYYTITIGGIIPVDTDFGPVLLDEQPVVRRIG